jgi:hypothetical protein
MAYTTIDDPTEYFETTIFTGNGSTQNITGLNFQPDWIWYKRTNSTNHHRLIDSVRGSNKNIATDLANAENTEATYVSSFNSDGWSIGSNTDINASNDTIVAWAWKAGGSASSNSDGSITSSVSASTAAGFSVVSYTATNANATVGHGLGQALDMLIVKNRDSSKDWRVWFKGFSGTERLELNNAEAKASTSTSWNGTVPSSSVFSLGDDTNTNNSTDEYIAYCFAGKKGYSKFGTYLGNSSTDGTFVYTGFKPAWIMVKKINSANDEWNMFDNKRDDDNVITQRLVANITAANAAGTYVDFLSNGFKWRINNNLANGNGNTYIYMAFAESPFVNSNGVPNNAR